MYRKYVKRIVDICCAVSVFALFWWLFLVIAVLVRYKLGSPVIFKQQRPGKDEHIFTLYKFRTMTDERDAEGKLLPDEVRLTKFGKWLRSTSLDEIPEFWNVLKGEMSLVGPRPLAVVYLPYYSEEERHRHDVRPGITGLAQVNGRNILSWEEKFYFDLQYIKTINCRNDFTIIYRTLFKMIKRENIGQGEFAPMSLHIKRKNG